MNSIITNPDQRLSREVNRYLEQESAFEFKCKPALQEIFLKVLPFIVGLTNPMLICKIFRKYIPVRIADMFYRKLFHVGNPGYLILYDLPKECAVENSFSAALTAIVSFPITYPGEGDLVISIKPRRNSAANPSFANSKEFLLHTDLSYVPIMPDVLTMCVKNIAINGGGESLVSTAADTLTTLSGEIYHQLCLKQFTFEAPTHYKTEFDTNKSALSIIHFSPNGLRVRFRYDKVRASTKAGAEAIEMFHSAVNVKKEQKLLPRFSAIILNQRYTLHGRTEFQPTYDENDRELTRSYGTISLGKFKSIDYGTGIVQC